MCPFKESKTFQAFPIWLFVRQTISDLRDMLAFIMASDSNNNVHLGRQVESINQLINKSANLEEHYVGTMGKTSIWCYKFSLMQEKIKMKKLSTLAIIIAIIFMQDSVRHYSVI